MGDFLISFYIEVELIYNVLFSGVQQSMIHAYLHSFFQILFPYRLLLNIE